MLVMLEGPPRAGKSYTAVREHILPALQKGRKVYARLNGLNHAKIAAHLSIEPERIRELLVIVSADEVLDLFVCEGDDPPRFKVDNDALVVIDEVHDFYVSGRQALPKPQEAFFAKHGHIGLDLVVMTQAIGRLHSAVRSRIERKQMFAKQNALGRDTHYTVRHFAVGDTMGKFEKIGSDSKEYDPAIFPLYAGFQPGTENTEAYSEGKKTVWEVIKKPAIVLVIALVVGIGFLVKFFVAGTDDMGVAKQSAAVPTIKPERATVQVGASPITAKPAPPAVKKKLLSPGVQYIVDMAAQARPRFLGEFVGINGPEVVVEFRASGGQAMERLTGRQLQELGFSVSRHAYGALAKGEGEIIVFTEWPIDVLFSQSSATTARIQAAAGPTPAPTTEAQPANPDAGRQGVLIAAGTNLANERP